LRAYAMSIPYNVMLLLGSVAEAAAADLGVMMAIALADGEGNLQFFIKMDRALPASTEIAISKAYSAAALRMPTSELGRLALPGEPLYGIDRTHGGKIILFGGGIPLSMGGEVVGGIGVSGGTVEEDERVAAAVVKAFGEMADLAGKISPCLVEALGNQKSLASPGKCLREAVQNVPLPPEISRLLVGSLLLIVGEH
jgi:uncharacterized protein GlcG (DUF336 family)